MTPSGIPQPPNIRFLNRRPQVGAPALTILRWDAVGLDTLGFPVGVAAYYIYRSTTANLENQELAEIITSRDINNNIDTCWSEENDGTDGSGYVQYSVAALSSANPGVLGPQASIAAVPTNQLEPLS